MAELQNGRSTRGMLRVNTAQCSDKYYAVAVRAALAQLGGVEVGAGKACDVYWHDAPIQRMDFAQVQPGQAINRFYGMVKLCRKVCLAQQLRWMEALCGPACVVSPRTWCLPVELELFKAQSTSGFYIVKPDSGCQGDGIALVRAPDVERRMRALQAMSCRRAVVQEYLPAPMLLGGLKFDLRLYVLLLSAHPFEAYLCTHGLARFATRPYAAPSDANASDMLRHLTNSTLNMAETGVSNKRSWAAVQAELRGSAALESEAGAAGSSMWLSIRHVVNVALRSICPLASELHDQAFPPAAFKAGARTSFQIVGIDVIIDAKRRAWLLELNHSPSMSLTGADADETSAKTHAVMGALRLSQSSGPADPEVAAACSEHALEPLHAEPWPPVDSAPSATHAAAPHAEAAAAAAAAAAAPPWLALREVRELFDECALPRPSSGSSLSFRFTQPPKGRTLSLESFRLLASRAGAEPACISRVFAEAVSAAENMGTGWEAASAAAGGSSSGREPEPRLPFRGFAHAVFLLAPLCTTVEAAGSAQRIAAVVAAMREGSGRAAPLRRPEPEAKAGPPRPELTAPRAAQPEAKAGARPELTAPRASFRRSLSFGVARQPPIVTEPLGSSSQHEAKARRSSAANVRVVALNAATNRWRM